MSPDHIRAEWAACRDWLLPALVDDTEGFVLGELLANRAQLWRGARSAMVTQLIVAVPPNICVWLGGGDLDDLMTMQPGVEAYGRMHGCKEARINGRQGWARALRKTGFEPFDGELRKVL